MEENNQDDIQEVQHDVQQETEHSQYTSVDKQLNGQSNVQQQYQGPAAKEQNVQPVKEKVNGFAVAGLICGIVSLVCCCLGFAFVIGIVGIVLSVVGMTQSPEGKKTMSIVALAISIVGTVFGIIAMIWILFAINNGDTSDYYYRIPESIREEYLRDRMSQIVNMIHTFIK